MPLTKVQGGLIESTNEPIILGAGSSTGIANQVLQVNGGAYLAGIGASVGIGTVNPTAKLTITDGVAPYAASTGDLLHLKRGVSNGNDTTSATAILIGNNSNTFRIAYGGTSDRLRFLDGGPVEVLSLMNGGRVGVNTSVPSSTFLTTLQNTSTVSAGILCRDSAGATGGYVSLGGAAAGSSSKTMVLQGANEVQVAVGDTTRLTVTIDGDIKFGQQGNLGTIARVTYNNGNANTISGANVNERFSIIRIATSDFISTTIPLFGNAGAGVGYRWTYLDPDAGTWTYSSAGSISVSFTQAGSLAQAFTVVISQDTGQVTVTRTSGSTAYTVTIHSLV